METPTWLKPAILGGIVGAIATVFVGFNEGGWMLGGADGTAAIDCGGGSSPHSGLH